MYHRFLSVWLVVGVLLASTLIAPRGASAGPFPPTCYGTSCNGQNPLTSYCSEGSVIVGQVGLLTRYYSPACNAYWGHLRSDTYIVVSAWMENNQSATLRRMTDWLAPGAREFYVDFVVGVARSKLDPAMKKAKVVKGRATARNLRSLARMLEKMD